MKFITNIKRALVALFLFYVVHYFGGQFFTAVPRFRC
jgi:hypothetical protein